MPQGVFFSPTPPRRGRLPGRKKPQRWASGCRGEAALRGVARRSFFPGERCALPLIGWGKQSETRCFWSSLKAQEDGEMSVFMKRQLVLSSGGGAGGGGGGKRLYLGSGSNWQNCNNS